MRCYYHPGAEAAAMCANCGKAICEACSVDVAGRSFCNSCLASGNLTRSQSSPVHPTKGTNPLAIASLILGLLGLCGGLPFSIAAWVTGQMARNQLLETQEQEGLQLANAGRLLGIAITLLNAILILCYLGAAIFALLQQQ
jgi:hypothetical protein